MACFFAFTLILNDLSSEHAVELEIVFFILEKYTITAMYASDKIQLKPSTGNMQKAPNTGNMSPGIQ